MVNRIVKKKPMQALADESGQGSSSMSAENTKPAYDLAHKAGCCSFFRQFSKTAGSRGPLFWACLCFTLLIAIIGIIALIIFLVYYVGIPTFSIKSVELPTSVVNGTEQKNVKIDLGNGVSGSASISFPIVVTVAVDNPNKLDLSFENIEVNAYHPKVPDVRVGRALLVDVVMPKEGGLLLKIYMNIKYSFKDDPLATIPQDLLDSCTIAPGQIKPSKRLILNIGLEPKMKITDVIKVQLPSINSQQSFDCPYKMAEQIDIGGETYSLRNLDFQAMSEGKLAFINRDQLTDAANAAVAA